MVAEAEVEVAAGEVAAESSTAEEDDRYCGLQAYQHRRNAGHCALALLQKALAAELRMLAVAAGELPTVALRYFRALESEACLLADALEGSYRGPKAGEAIDELTFSAGR